MGALQKYCLFAIIMVIIIILELKTVEWHFKLSLLAKTWRIKTDKSVHIQCHQSRWIFA